MRVPTARLLEVGTSSNEPEFRLKNSDWMPSLPAVVSQKRTADNITYIFQYSVENSLTKYGKKHHHDHSVS